MRGAAAYKDEALLDARLDGTGRMQALALGAALRAAGTGVELVLVSPMTRALETASLMFSEDGGGGGGGWAARPPFVAVELCREAFGSHPCDARRSVTALAAEFPHVDFSGVATNEDTWHDPHRRETVREVSARCDHFLAALRERVEKNIVVVSHGVFLETLLTKCGLLVVDDNIKAGRFDNAECRSIILGGWT